MATLTTEDQEKISATIAEVESRTAGEVVVALVSQSDDYADVRYPAAFGLTMISAIATSQFASGWLLDYLIPLQLPIFLICFQLTKVPAFTRFLAGPALSERCRERAMQMFIERGIHNTRDQSGLLVMLSELEHQVVILGDAGIHQKVGDAGWEGYIERIVTGLKGGQAAASIVAVLHDLGAQLAAHFPARSDDTDELANEVVVQA